MHNEMNEEVRQNMVNEIACLISTGNNYAYKDFMKHLKDEHKLFLRGHMMLNKFLYGSLVHEAKQMISV